jgi:hypothetical protein
VGCLLVKNLLLLLLENQLLLILLQCVNFEAFNDINLQFLAFFVRQFLQIELEHLFVTL